MTTVVGIDIASGRWAVVELSWEDGRVVDLAASTVAYGQLEFSPRWALAVVDIPVGLMKDEDAKTTPKGRSGDRPADRGARRWCPSTSSVFPPPTLGQFRTGIEEHRRAACALKPQQERNLAAVTPGGLSKQSFELLPAIADAAQLKSTRPDVFFESHPEVAFSAWAAGVLPVAKGLKKKALAGIVYRAALLTERLGLDVLPWVAWQELQFHIPANDWLDALAMATVALDWSLKPEERRVLRDAMGQVLPYDGEHDLLMALPHTVLRAPPAKLEFSDVMNRLDKCFPESSSAED